MMERGPSARVGDLGTSVREPLALAVFEGVSLEYPSH